LLGWSLIDEPYLAVSLQLFNGLAFGVLWLAAVAYARRIAPAGMATTAQGLLGGMYFGLSSLVGALLGGVWYEQFGPWEMFRWGAWVMLVGLVVYVLVGGLAPTVSARRPARQAS